VVERSAVNRLVVGSNPTAGANFCLRRVLIAAGLEGTASVFDLFPVLKLKTDSINPILKTMTEAPKPVEITSIHDFLSAAKDLYGSHHWGIPWLFRGQSRTREEWPLMPKAGRIGFFEPVGQNPALTTSLSPTKWAKIDRHGYTSPQDMYAFSQWRNRAIAYRQVPDDDWACLALAQNYGLATRLLDWTRNPLVGLFFAACADSDIDGAVYAYGGCSGLITNESFEEIKQVMEYAPKPFDSRILAQQTTFTFHPSPTTALTPAAYFKTSNPRHNQFGTNLIEFVVPAGTAKEYILKDLAVLGISRSSLFPDLEGLSWELNNAHTIFRTIKIPIKVPPPSPV
jgi:hypothetical protein